MALRTSLALVMIGLLTQPRPAQTQTQATVSATTPASTEATRLALDAAVRATIAERRAPGMAVVVLRGSETLLAAGYGVSDVATGGTMSAQSVFPLGSITKQFTATAILKLVDEGRVQLSDSIGLHLPGYPAIGRRVSLSALLSHTSGIANYTELPVFRARAQSLGGPADVRELFANEPLRFQPGTAWAYSNSGYLLLGQTIERVAGMSYDDYIRTRIALPLGLRSIALCDKLAPADVRGYISDEGVTRAAATVSPSISWAAGGLCGTPADVARWTTMLGRRAVLSAGSYLAMITPVVLANGRATSYGLGMEVTTLGPHARLGHGGSIAGIDGYAAYYPGSDVTVVVLLNNGSANAEAVEKRFARVVLNVPDATLSELPVSSSERARYVGEYRAGPGRLRVSVNGERLHVSGPVEADLIRTGANTFVLADEPDVRLEFTIVGSAATELAWTSRGRTLKLPRVP